MDTPTPLRRFRTDTLKISVDRLAQLTQTSKASISRMERGLQPVTIDLVRRIAALSENSTAKTALTRELMLCEAQP